MPTAPIARGIGPTAPSNPLNALDNNPIPLELLTACCPVCTMACSVFATDAPAEVAAFSKSAAASTS